jgi:hypothetical protein
LYYSFCSTSKVLPVSSLGLAFFSCCRIFSQASLPCPAWRVSVRPFFFLVISGRHSPLSLSVCVSLLLHARLGFSVLDFLCRFFRLSWQIQRAGPRTISSLFVCVLRFTRYSSRSKVRLSQDLGARSDLASILGPFLFSS